MTAIATKPGEFCRLNQTKTAFGQPRIIVNQEGWVASPEVFHRQIIPT